MSRLQALGQRFGLANPKVVSNLTFNFYLFFVFEYFIRLSSRIPGFGVIRPTLLMVLILTAMLFMQMDSIKHRFKHPSVKALNALLIYIALTLPFVSWPGSVIKNNLPEFVKAIVFFYFTVAIVDSPRRLVVFLTLFVGCQIFRVMEPLFMHVTTGYWGSATYIGGGEFLDRLSGGPYDVINSNELGFVIVTIIPFIHYLLLPRGGWRKLAYYLLLPALLYALMLTASRGAFLAVIVVGIFIFLRTKRKVLLLTAVAIIAVVGWSQMNEAQRERYLSLTGADVRGAKTAEGRVHGVEREFELAMDRPIFGHGVGTTPEAKFHRYGKKQASHSLYAELIIEIGIIGMYFFLRFVLSSWRNLKQLVAMASRQAADTDEKTWQRDLIVTMQCVFWMYLFYSSNYWGLSQYYWYLFCGLSVVIATQLIDGSLSPQPKKGPLGARR